MDSLAIIELQRWGFPGVTKCRHRSIEFLTTQADQSKRDILIDYVLTIIIKTFFGIKNLLKSGLPYGDINRVFHSAWLQVLVTLEGFLVLY